MTDEVRRHRGDATKILARTKGPGWQESLAPAMTSTSLVRHEQEKGPEPPR